MRRRSRRHDVPAHHRAAGALDEYVEAAGLEEPKAALFQSVDPAGERLAGRALTRRAVPGDDQAAHRRRRAAAVDSTCCDTFRATGITALPLERGNPEHPQQITAVNTRIDNILLADRGPTVPHRRARLWATFRPGVGSGGRVAGRVGELALPSGEGGRGEGHGTGPRGDLVEHGRPARGCRGRARSRPGAASG